MKVYDSLTKSEMSLNLDPKKVFNLYVCGPTVYNYIHLGNVRPDFTIDFLVRFLEFEGYEVNYLQNLTDIDDKIINSALETKTDELELSNFYGEKYLEDLAKLNIRLPNKIIKVSETIEPMITFIQKLLDQKSAYQVDGDVYFDVKKYADQYGKLSGRKISDLEKFDDPEPNLKKHSLLDFALWKQTNLGLKWTTPFGEGRPGWHTECVVMIDQYFNHEPIDLHAGGVDLKFPHHENERIQFWALYEKELAKTWMHNGHLMVNDTKMSKSLGNFILVKDFLNNYPADLLRWIFMTTGFTQPLDINDQLLEQGQTFLNKIKNLNKKAKQLFALNKLTELPSVHSENNLVDQFRQLMNENLNTPLVLTLIEQAMKNINIHLLKNELSTDWHELQIILHILGFTHQLDYYVLDEDKQLFQRWQKLVDEKDFTKADELRQQLIAKGLV